MNRLNQLLKKEQERQNAMFKKKDLLKFSNIQIPIYGSLVGSHKSLFQKPDVNQMISDYEDQFNDFTYEHHEGFEIPEYDGYLSDPPAYEESKSRGTKYATDLEKKDVASESGYDLRSKSKPRRSTRLHPHEKKSRKTQRK